MRRISAIGLVLIISVQAFYNAGVLAYWLANHGYIATALCENRDKPMLHCDGKCYLRKKLAAQQEIPLDSQKKSVSMAKGIELAEVPAAVLPAGVPFSAEHSPLIGSTDQIYSRLFPHKVFHPPCLSA